MILSWLGLERPSPRVGLRPYRTLRVQFPLEVAYKKCLEGIERTLGATPYTKEIDPDRGAAFIEAGFGLVNSERLQVSLAQDDAMRTTLRMEAFYPASAGTTARALSVDALADYLNAIE